MIKHTGRFKKAFKRSVKRLVMAQAVKHNWPLDKIQYAEDYIDKLSLGRSPTTQSIPKTIGLEAHYARRIRDVIKGQKKSKRWEHGKWQTSS